MQILSQRDPKWGNIKLGTSATFIKDYGCTITCIAMIVGTTPDVVNDRMKAVGGFSNGNLVIWAKIAEAFPGISVNRVWSYDNTAVLAAVPNVLVEVDAKPIGGTGKHWVVYVGNKRLYDPWTGTDRPTSDFPGQSGYCVLTGKWAGAVTNSNSSDLQKELDKTRQERDNNWNLYVQFKDAGYENIDKVRAELQGKQTTIDNLNQQINDRNNDITQLNAKLSTLEAQLLEVSNARDSALNQAKLIPQLTAERDELVSQKEIWIKKEKDYLKKIDELSKNKKDSPLIEFLRKFL